MNNLKIIEIFPNIQAAEKAYKCALECGYSPQVISIIMSENYYNSKLSQVETINTLKDMGKGGGAGATIGGVLGAMVALGATFIVPGIGIIIAGPLAGVVAGTLMGTLLALSISETQAQEYSDALESGQIIVSVDAENDSDLEKKWAKVKSECI